MRKQYYFRPSDRGYDAWDVDRLIDRAAALPVDEVPMDDIVDLAIPHWFGADGGPLTVRILVNHVRFVNDADLSYPITLGADGRVMDGMHRVARALLDGRVTVPAVRFAVQPEPDHRGCLPSELPY